MRVFQIARWHNYRLRQYKIYLLTTQNDIPLSFAEFRDCMKKREHQRKTRS